MGGLTFYLYNEVSTLALNKISGVTHSARSSMRSSTTSSSPRRRKRAADTHGVPPPYVVFSTPRTLCPCREGGAWVFGGQARAALLACLRLVCGSSRELRCQPWCQRLPA